MIRPAPAQTVTTSNMALLMDINISNNLPLFHNIRVSFFKNDIIIAVTAPETAACPGGQNKKKRV